MDERRLGPAGRAAMAEAREQARTGGRIDGAALAQVCADGNHDVRKVARGIRRCVNCRYELVGVRGS